MLTLRPVEEIGGGDLGWLKARHHFAIGAHGNPEHRPVGDLIVLNDDEIAPGKGFPMHGHADVEIVTYVREGAITHQDSLGNVGRTEAGDVQVMSAGSGVWHSENNAETGPTRLFQIWLTSRQKGGSACWDKREFPREARAGRFIPLASGLGAPDALPIRANAEVLGAMLPEGGATSVELAQGQSAYLVASRGRLSVNGVTVRALDGLVAHDEPQLTISALEDADVLLVVTGVGPTP